MTRTDKTISEQQHTIRHYGKALQESRDTLIDAFRAADEGSPVREILYKRLVEIGMLK